MFCYTSCVKTTKQPASIGSGAVEMGIVIIFYVEGILGLDNVYDNDDIVIFGL